MILFTKQSRFFFSYSTLPSFLKELHNRNLLTPDCKIHFTSPAQKLLSLPWALLNPFNIWLFLVLGSLLVHENWNLISYQYLFDIFLTIKAQAAPWPILEVSFLHLDSNKYCSQPEQGTFAIPVWLSLINWFLAYQDLYCSRSQANPTKLKSISIQLSWNRFQMSFYQ